MVTTMMMIIHMTWRSQSDSWRSGRVRSSATLVAVSSTDSEPFRTVTDTFPASTSCNVKFTISSRAVVSTSLIYACFLLATNMSDRRYTAVVSL